MSYDKDVLNQRSDPTLNQIDNNFSLKKMFFASEMEYDFEEEKRVGGLNNRGKPHELFNITSEDLLISKNFESEFVSSAASLANKFNAPSALNDLLSFDDARASEIRQSEVQSAVVKNLNFNDDINIDQEYKDIINKAKNTQDKDDLINNLLLVVKNLSAKLKDLENTSRANSAMLDNVIKKKKDLANRTMENADVLLRKFKKQSILLDSLNDLNTSTSDSNSDSEYPKSKSIKDITRSKTSCSELSIQTEPKPAAFPFSCQTNFANHSDQKIKELESMLLKQEAEFTLRLEEAKKMDDVEDAFQAFLDQLDLNENEERIIIDGESRVWKIIR